MADDLDDFLKQAALRRQQRQQAKGGKPASAPPPQLQQQPPRQPAKARIEPDIPNLKTSIPSSETDSYSTPYKPTIGNLSAGLPSSSLPSSLEQGGDRVNTTIKPSFQNEISKIRVAEASKGNNSTRVLKETPATIVEPQQSSMVSSASMIHQLRDPQTMRMAIIAHEILKRPWQ